MRHQQKQWARQKCAVDTKTSLLTHRRRANGSHLPLRAWCSHCVKGLARDWVHRSDYGPPPDIPMVAMDFGFANTESDDDVLTILAMQEKPFQPVGAIARSSHIWTSGDIKRS